MVLWRWLLVLTIWGQLSVSLPSLAASVTTVDTARRTVLMDGLPPLDDATVAIPDRLKPLWHAPQIHIHYELSVPEGGDAKGLWLARVGAPFRLLVDGRPLQPFLPAIPAEASADKAFNGRMPFLFALPPDARTVRIDFAGTAYMPTGLAAAQWGPPSALAVAQLERHEQMIRPAEVNTVLAAVLGSLAFVLWLARRDVILLPIFAAICATLTLRNWSFTVALLPLDTERAYLFNSLLSVSLTITVLASVLALSNRLVWRNTRWVVVATGALLLPLMLVQWFPSGVVSVRLGILFLSLLNIPVCVWLLHRWRHDIGGHAAYVLMAGLLILLAVSVHDLSWTLGYQPPMRISYVPLAFAGLLLCYAYITAEHVLRNLHLVENANAMLQQQIERAREQLQSSHAQLSQLQAKQARQTERAQLVGSLHQGLGQRLSALTQDIEAERVDPTQTREQLELSLQNLRQLLSVHQSNESVVMALATWRPPWQARLETSDIPLRWLVDDSADDATLPTHRLMTLVDSLSEVAETIWRADGPLAGRRIRLHVRVEEPHRLQVTLQGWGVPAPPDRLLSRLKAVWHGDQGAALLTDASAVAVAGGEAPDWQWQWMAPCALAGEGADRG